jgi:hypothetical protein
MSREDDILFVWISSNWIIQCVEQKARINISLYILKPVLITDEEQEEHIEENEQQRDRNSDRDKGNEKSNGQQRETQNYRNLNDLINNEYNNIDDMVDQVHRFSKKKISVVKQKS